MWYADTISAMRSAESTTPHCQIYSCMTTFRPRPTPDVGPKGSAHTVATQADPFSYHLDRRWQFRGGVIKAALMSPSDGDVNSEWSLVPATRLHSCDPSSRAPESGRSCAGRSIGRSIYRAIFCRNLRPPRECVYVISPCVHTRVHCGYFPSCGSGKHPLPRTRSPLKR